MKNLYCAFTVLVLLALPLFSFADEEIPTRVATPVEDAYEPYTADEWIVSTEEEPEGDLQPTEEPECDIMGIIACADADYLRIDILLAHSVSFEWDTFYAIKIEYDSMSEFYTYYIASEELVYEKEKGGKVVQSKKLTSSNSKDLAGVADSDEITSADIYFFINKQDHIAGTKGKKYFLTCSFYSGYITESNALTIADKTIEVNVEFAF